MVGLFNLQSQDHFRYRCPFERSFCNEGWPWAGAINGGKGRKYGIVDGFDCIVPFDISDHIGHSGCNRIDLVIFVFYESEGPRAIRLKKATGAIRRCRGRKFSANKRS